MIDAAKLRNAVRFEIGNPGREAVPDDQIDVRVDESYVEVLTRFRHPEIEETVEFSTEAGEPRYDLPEDYWYTQSLRDLTNNIRLTYRPIEWLDNKTFTGEGLPEYYTRRGETGLLVAPTPHSENLMRLRYARRVPKMRGEGTTIVSDAWDEIVRWGAVWRMFQALSQQDRMIHTRNIWRTLVNSMPENESLEKEKSPQFIEPIRRR